MKFWTLLLLCPSLALAEPKKPAPLPPLPVIEVRQTSTPLPPAASNSSIELKPVEGQKLEPLSGRGVRYWNSPYGMPSGPGRAWPQAGPPGNSGPAGGLLTPAGPINY
jgi:hypothetical protein